MSLRASTRLARRHSACSALALITLTALGIVGVRDDAQAAAADIVLYASDAQVVRGHWAQRASSGAAGSMMLAAADTGWSTTEAPLASPAHYVEFTFAAPADTAYQVWLRLRASGNSKWNDSVWVQFSDAVHANGNAAYRMHTTNGLLVNLARCGDCTTDGWGWQDASYWLKQPTRIEFSSSGSHTLRVQTREDGVEIDQVVLSPANFASKAPGRMLADATIVPKPASARSTPFSGRASSLPGTILARNFDEGGEGIAYHDSTGGNLGREYRQADVDLQDSSLGGHNVGWIMPGEWLKYTVTVPKSGNYLVGLRTASPNTGAAVAVAFDKSNVSQSVVVQNTGGWQTWKDHEFAAALVAGEQVLTVSFPQGGVNIHSVSVSPPHGVAPPPPPAPPTPPAPPPPPAPPRRDDDDDDDDRSGKSPPPTGKGGEFRMLTWNVKHGHNLYGSYNPVAQAQYIASQNPHVVVLQEVQDWVENLPGRYKSLLEQYTGVPWSLQWAPVINKPYTEGNLVLTRLPVVSSTYHQMHATGDWHAMYSNRSAAQATVLVGGIPVHVFSVHLDYYNTTHRTAQLLDMMAWARTFGARRIVAGDFNAMPREYWITNMKGDYFDTWHDLTGSDQHGGTINGVRFDYQFRAKEAADLITPLTVRTPSTTFSDHNPVIADYRVR
jgi:endonuclease/exonuclease/phosphatase family metal-dependent hydrolase